MHNQRSCELSNEMTVQLTHLQSIYIATDRRYMKALTEVQWRLYF